MLAVSPGRRDRTKRPIAWAKNSGVEALVAYTPTASRGTSTPSDTMRTATNQRLVSAENSADAVRRSRVVGEHDCRRFAGDLGQQVGVGAGGGLVGGDDHAAGVGHVLAQLLQPGVGGGDHGGHPLAGRVQRRTPGACGLLGGEWLTEAGGVFLAGAVAPPRLPGVGQEHHRADDAVGQCFRVAVGVIGLRAQESVAVGFVTDERDRAVVAAERRPGERESAGGVAERLTHRLAPALRVAAVVDLVEDDERAVVLGAHPMPRRGGWRPGRR